MGLFDSGSMDLLYLNKASSTKAVVMLMLTVVRLNLTRF